MGNFDQKHPYLSKVLVNKIFFSFRQPFIVQIFCFSSLSSAGETDGKLRPEAPLPVQGSGQQGTAQQQWQELHAHRAGPGHVKDQGGHGSGLYYNFCEFCIVVTYKFYAGNKMYIF